MTHYECIATAVFAAAGGMIPAALEQQAKGSASSAVIDHKVRESCAEEAFYMSVSYIIIVTCAQFMHNKQGVSAPRSKTKVYRQFCHSQTVLSNVV